MLFDDRLATVLRHRATGERAARTQYRQLLDLLGSAQGSPNGNGKADTSIASAAFLRLNALAELIPVAERARIVAESGKRIRNPELVKWFAQAEPGIASTALARSALSEREWASLIPELPIRARGFLRHRDDLPAGALAVLDRLGVSDRGLPEPEKALPALEVPDEQSDAAIPADAILAERIEDSSSDPASSSGIGDIRRRIEAFQKARDHTEAVTTPRQKAPPSLRPSDPALPLEHASSTRIGGGFGATSRPPLVNFAFSTDVDGRVDWADAPVAPMVVGTDLIAPHALQGASDSGFASAFFDRRPMREATLVLAGAERVAGEWLVDASPRFTRSGGRFYGYLGRFRRPTENTAQDRAAAQADRIRQLLHELRTPVNAIQGFAEVIQQQIFGPTPHEYRALAAAIAGDSARMLAGFDELDRLAKLEGGISEMDSGQSDIAAILRRQSQQLQTVLSPRVARLATEWALQRAIVGIAPNEAELLAWRILATIASATGAGETVMIRLVGEDHSMRLRCALPNTLSAAKDVFSTDTRPAMGALSSGIFGAGFALRLARAEARAIGGDLFREEDDIVLSLPTLMAGDADRPSFDAHDALGGDLRKPTAR
ncbi:histidine kinase dimerization/phospho-acceptor domain-containing protein [Erythrobacter sp. A6_0]|uniref:histidine kinase dimerization/phospho-acceptor domain-containing protein n=1 Tax=Erythrobacter sp. A6_0 TaxID=2821089 RepID=UPI001ADA9DE7|nr:histidine kinase dimerization/phospho-acceptor domain-containing protein [Erythrobacter sp. A6_0]MBO9510345.1 sensor histidine kinase [Erythrobacter sp. A6_0]